MNTLADANIHLRTSEDVKSVIAQAAEATGSTITQFVLDRVLPDAQSIVAEHEKIKLSDQDWEKIKHRMDEPPRNLPELKKFLNEKPKFW